MQAATAKASTGSHFCYMELVDGVLRLVTTASKDAAVIIGDAAVATTAETVAPGAATAVHVVAWVEAARKIGGDRRRLADRAAGARHRGASGKRPAPLSFLEPRTKDGILCVEI